MTGYFISNQESEYYQSGAFSAILSYVQKNPGTCRMKETESRLSLTFRDVKSVGSAIAILEKITSS